MLLKDNLNKSLSDVFLLVSSCLNRRKKCSLFCESDDSFPVSTDMVTARYVNQRNSLVAAYISKKIMIC